MVNNIIQTIMTYEQEKATLLAKIKELEELYLKFTTRTSPTYWRTTGSHFSELRAMKKDIPKFTEMTKEELESDWVKEALMR